MPPKYAIQWGSVRHRSPLKSRDFYRKYGIRTQNNFLTTAAFSNHSEIARFEIAEHSAKSQPNRLRISVKKRGFLEFFQKYTPLWLCCSLGATCTAEPKILGNFLLGGLQFVEIHLLQGIALYPPKSSLHRYVSGDCSKQGHTYQGKTPCPRDPPVLKILRRVNFGAGSKFSTDAAKRYGEGSEVLVFLGEQAGKRYGYLKLRRWQNSTDSSVVLFSVRKGPLLGCTRRGLYSAKDVFLPSKHLLSAF